MLVQERLVYLRLSAHRGTGYREIAQDPCSDLQLRGCRLLKANHREKLLPGSGYIIVLPATTACCFH